MIDLDAIEKRANAATAGPWTWDVNLKGRTMALEGRGFGNETVIGFARWGMSGARALFRRRLSDGVQILADAESFATPKEGRAHHAHWTQDIDQPDAQFIAHARTDIPALIEEVRRLNRIIHDMGLPDANDFPHPTGGIL